MSADWDAPAVSMPRVDAMDKVLGRTRYVADERLPPGTLHAAWAGSAVARGRARAINLEAVRMLPGVSLVLTHAEMPRLLPHPRANESAWFGEDTAPMQDDYIHHVGQPLAIVAAGTPEQAEHAARALRFSYEAEPPVLGFDGEASWPEHFGELELQVRRGDAVAAFASSPVKVQHVYDNPLNYHAAMELPAAVAAWSGDRLDLWVTCRGVIEMRKVVAHAFGLAAEHVRVLCPYVGGAFGSKGWLFHHAVLTAAAARVAGRPVRLVLTRGQTFDTQGHRGLTRQTVALGATRDGRLAAIRQDVTAQTSYLARFTELAGAMTPRIYACPAVQVSHRLVRANVSSPTPMRGPGEAPGSFAFESAMDELATELAIDPVELRLRNLPHAGDPQSGKPWTSFNLAECWRRGAEAFGWAARDPRPGASLGRANLPDDELIGWGCATAAYPANRRNASAAAALVPDGTVDVMVASHDAGHGTYTALTILAADALGLPPERIRVMLGDTRFPEAPTSGGSSSLASAGPAVIAACEALQHRLAELSVMDPGSPFAGHAAGRIFVTAGRIAAAGNAPQGEDWLEPLRRGRLNRVEVTAHADAGHAKETHGTMSFGVHFVEVRVHARLRSVRVTRYAGVYDVGRVLVPAQTRSQILGGVMFGIGQALMEHGVTDRAGRLATPDLASYHIPGCADVPAEFDVQFIDVRDPLLNPMGTRGVGEIGVAGVAGAVANAVHHACGKRVRDLPITVEKLLF